MRKSVQYYLDAPDSLVGKLLAWCERSVPVCLLNSNGFSTQNKAIIKSGANRDFDVMAGVGAVHELHLEGGQNGFDVLKKAADQHRDWMMGYLSYDLKNHTEKLVSGHPDGIGFPVMHFFIPRYLFILKDNQITINYLPEYDNETAVKALVGEILEKEVIPLPDVRNIVVKPRISRAAYLQKVKQLKQHIQRGDIYEVNFCQEMFAEKVTIDPRSLYRSLNEHSPAPFSAYYALNGRYLLCASPERYLRKTGSKLYSQPIKGTIKRGKDAAEDEKLKETLLNDPKERSENVMIVDLVRNDLSRTARRGSVKVEELFGVYTFPQVHQLISTISAELEDEVHFVDAIRYSFPMGSMTGAPKIRAMELIEAYEESRRGLFSGAVGYITPEGDFDFNVVIRSILYNETAGYLSMTVGGAITIKSDEEKEYEECLLKAKAIMKVLNAENSETHIS